MQEKKKRSPTTSGRTGHNALFPGFTRDTSISRRLCVLKEKRFIDSKGNIKRYRDYDEMKKIMFDDNLLSFIDDFTAKFFYEYLENCIHDKDCDVMSDTEGNAHSVRFKFGRQTRWIVRSKSWNSRAEVDFILRLDSLFAWLKCGSHATPGALGTWLVRKSWRENRLAFHTSPNDACCDYIYTHQVGMRVDTPGLNNFYEFSVDYDAASAFLGEHILQPTKTSIRYDAEPSGKYFTWFGKCVVTIKSELALGCFPVRLGSGLIVYPSLPGKYITYIWKEQYEECLIAGCKIICDGGYGWLESTFDTLSWCEDMYFLKLSAPEKYLEDWTKQIIVSAIGRYGMHGDFHSIVSRELATKDDMRLTRSDGTPTHYFIHKESNRHAIPMPHWNNYTGQRVALDTYKFALPFAERGTLVSTNCDSVLVFDVSVVPGTVRKYSIDSALCEVSTWRWELLHNVFIPAPRSINSDEKVRRPGVTRVKEFISE